jgi:multiple sugar transport system ATP-binding protein
VAKNMSFGLSLNGMKRDEIDRRVQEAAEILRIGDLLHRKPKQLSGGQRQRVAIGRAIVRKPQLFLLDEPLSNLDAALRVTMRAELAALHERLGVTMIYVTHDQVEAMTLADRVVVLDKGRVSQFGAPLELFHRPANLFVAGFIGTPKMNLFQGRVTGQTGPRLEVEVNPGAVTLAVELAAPVAGSVGRAVSLGVRPDRLLVSADGQGLPGRVTLVERLGTESHVHVALDSGQAVTAITGGAIVLSARQPVRISFAPEDVYLFDAAGRALPRKLDPITENLLTQDRRAAAAAHQQEETA